MRALFVVSLLASLASLAGCASSETPPAQTTGAHPRLRGAWDAEKARAAVDAVDLSSCPRSPVPFQEQRVVVGFTHEGTVSGVWFLEQAFPRLRQEGVAESELGRCITERLRSVRIAAWEDVSGKGTVERVVSTPWGAEPVPPPPSRPTLTECERLCKAAQNAARGEQSFFGDSPNVDSAASDYAKRAEAACGHPCPPR